MKYTNTFFFFWHAGALPVELNVSRSLRTIVAGTMMKCCEATQSANAGHCRVNKACQEVGAGTQELAAHHLTALSRTRGMAARGLARVEVEGLPTSVTSDVTLKPAVSIDLFT